MNLEPDGESMNKSHKKTFLVFLILMLMLGGLTLADFLASATRRSDAGTAGNTSANLYNGGLFCETDEYIYFSNIEDGGTLYRMKKDLSGEEKIYNDVANHINADEHYIFYSRRNNLRPKAEQSVFTVYNTGLFRIKYSGSSLKAISKNPVGAVLVYDNKAYYQRYIKSEGTKLCRADISGDNEEVISGEGISPLGVKDGYLYYSGLNDEHYIHRLNTETLADEIVYSGASYMPVVFGDRIFFISTHNGHKLVSVNTEGEDYRVHADFFVSSFNISPDGSSLFFTADNSENNHIGICNISTGETSVLMEGNFNSLHVAGNYLFFRSFDGTTDYVYNLRGNSSPQIFKTGR